MVAVVILLDRSFKQILLFPPLWERVLKKQLFGVNIHPQDASYLRAIVQMAIEPGPL